MSMVFSDDPQKAGSKSYTGLIVVAVFHVILGWALVNGLARKIVEVVKEPLETKIIEEVKPPPPPPPENLPPPPKNLPPPPAFVPPPEVQVAQPNPAPSITTTTVAPPPQEVRISAAPPVVNAPPAPPRAAARPAIANVGACAPTAADYPSAATRAEATGTTRVRFTIDGAGKLAKAEVVKSAGPSREHRLLDRVAVQKLSDCTFSPGLDENGRPAGGTFDVDYVWKLE